VDIRPWIAGYAGYLESGGYVGKTIRVRLQHLECLARFFEARGLKTLEEFDPRLAGDFIDYWVRQPMGKNSRGFKRKSRFEPHHHICVQYSLRSFFRWAHATGCMQRNVFAPASVADGFCFPKMTDYLLFCKRHKGLAKATLAKAELLLHRFDRFLRSVPLTAWDQLRSGHIDLFVRRHASHNIERIQEIHTILRGLFHYLFSMGCVDRDWASALISPRRYFLARTPRALPSEQVLRLLKSIDRKKQGGKRDFAVILVAASLGVRVSEIAALCLDHLDWVHAIASFPPIKGKNVLRLPLSRPVIEALADYLKNERPAGSAHRNVFLTLRPPFKPLVVQSVSSLVGRRMRQAGIRGSGHGLRHSFAGEMLRAGVSFSSLQELLGHSNFTSTQVYTKIDLVQLREVANNDAEEM
jgi:site-specific recombinase XerD